MVTVISTAYIMLGIDEIGIQIEQPFDILPLTALATILTNDVKDELLDIYIPKTSIYPSSER